MLIPEAQENFRSGALVEAAVVASRINEESRMPDDLEKLINEGPDRDRGLTALVLSRFAEIQLARQYARPWAKIAAALHLAKGKEKALSAAFWRVAKGIESGRLKAPPVNATAKRPGPPAAPAKPAPAFKDVTPED